MIWKSDYDFQKKKEPIYETIPLKRMSLFNGWVKKNSNPTSVETPKLQPISPPLTSVSFVDRIAKMKFLFSKKPNITPFENSPALTSAHTETASIHKPFVLAPSFVFGENIEEQTVFNETFGYSVPSKKIEKKNLKMDQSVLDLAKVVVSYTKEDYVPPSSLPQLPPLLFHTFKRPNHIKPKEKIVTLINSNPDAIELAPDQN